MSIFAPSDLDFAGKRLPLIASRVIKPPKDGAASPADGHDHGHDHHHHHHHDHHHHDLHPHGGHHSHTSHHGSVQGPIGEATAIFAKSHAAANFELFYDLWFVANLNVFTSVHEIADTRQLLSYIGFIVLLWTTWLMVTIYDVRFNADCVFERVCKAIHLGVMVGFAMIGTSFNPDNQIKSIFQAMSFFLAVSRMTLCVQHSVLAYQVRRFAEGPRPMLITSFLNFAAGAIYFGIAFRFDPNRNSRVFVVWYVVSVVEMALHLGFSQMTQVLTFVGSHFGERLNLLTLIIIGEGCIIVAKNVTLIVKDTYLKGDTAMWTPKLIGIMTASAALLYIIFQLYFDWMHEEQGDALYEKHQIWWASFHLPFHVALVLLLEGASQFVIWHRILEDVDKATKGFLDSTDPIEHNPTTDGVVEAYQGVVYKWLKKYPPAEPVETYQKVVEIFEDLSTLPDTFWSTSSSENPDYEKYMNDILELTATLTNSIFYAFGIEAPEGAIESTGSGDATNAEYIQSQSTMAISQRFVLIFIYAFGCAGIVLIFLSIMHVMSKRKGWSPFNVFRTAVCIAFGIGLSLTGLLVLNENYVDDFMGSAWMLPTIAAVYSVILLMTHMPHPPSFGLGRFAENKVYVNIEKQHGNDGENVALHNITLNKGDLRRRESTYSTYDDFRSPGLMAPSPAISDDAHMTSTSSSFVDVHNGTRGGVPATTAYDPASDGCHQQEGSESAVPATGTLYPVDLYDDDDHHHPDNKNNSSITSNRLSSHSQHYGGVQRSVSGVSSVSSRSSGSSSSRSRKNQAAHDPHEGRRVSMPLEPAEKAGHKASSLH